MTPTRNTARHAAAALACALAFASAAPARAAGGLDSLVAEGLAANRGLRAERLQVRRADAAVLEAIGLFLPSASVNARLSDRRGNIMDLGKLINPAFGALDQILNSPVFPTDLELKLPAKQETYVRVTQPLLDRRLPANLGIRTGQRDAQRAMTGAAARQLAYDLRRSYLDVARATRLVALYDSTLVLVDEAVRVQESLLAHGVATPDQVLRARADRGDIEQKRADAARLAGAARQLFNQQLGRRIDAPLPLLAEEALGLERSLPLDSALASAARHREELAAARAGVRAARGQMTLANAGYWPSLAAAIDWGVQGEHYDFGRGQDYRVASLVLQWPLFDGFQREARHAEAAADLARARTLQGDAAARIELDVRTSWEACEVARGNVGVARERLAAAKRTWELVAKRHANGAASLLELLDARTNLTAAATAELFATYDYWQRCADLDRAAALDSDRSLLAGDLR